MAPRIVADTNVIIRYLTGDDKVQSASSTELFRAAQSGTIKLVIPASTIQEAVYVLETEYSLRADAIAPKLISLLSLPNVSSPGSRWLTEALQFYRNKNSDFGDALLCAYAHAEGCDVATFDKGILKKFPEVTAYTPTDWLSGKAAARNKAVRN